jgi:serine/threonine protein kinase
MKRKKIEHYIVYMQELLGEGSFGRVYKGTNDESKEPVAVKVLDKKASKASTNIVDEDNHLKNAVFL